MEYKWENEICIWIEKKKTNEFIHYCEAFKYDNVRSSDKYFKNYTKIYEF